LYFNIPPSKYLHDVSKSKDFGIALKGESILEVTYSEKLLLQLDEVGSLLCPAGFLFPGS
jgi:hypothetical protein